METFAGKDDNNKYLKWVKDHEMRGFVFNVGKGTLHRATCRFVNEGNRFDPEQPQQQKKLRASDSSSKICYESREEAESHISDRKFKRCRSCDP